MRTTTFIWGLIVTLGTILGILIGLGVKVSTQSAVTFVLIGLAVGLTVAALTPSRKREESAKAVSPEAEQPQSGPADSVSP